MTRRSKGLVLAVALWMQACGLSPQPLPPGSSFSGGSPGTGSASGADAGAGGGFGLGGADDASAPGNGFGDSGAVLAPVDASVTDAGDAGDANETGATDSGPDDGSSSGDSDVRDAEADVSDGAIVDAATEGD